MAIDPLFFYGVSSLCISSLTLVGNAITLLAFYRQRSLRVKPSNMLIMALTFNDLIYGFHIFFLTGIPFTLQRYYGYFFGEIGCKIAASTNHLFVIGNLILLAISVDRVLLICMKYSTYVRLQTRWRIGITIAMCYVAGVALAVTEMGLWDYAQKDPQVAKKLNYNRYCLSPPRNRPRFGMLLSFGFYVTPIIIVLLLNIIFFTILIRKLKRGNKVSSVQINSLQTGTTGVNTRNSRSSQVASVSGNQAPLRNQNRNEDANAVDFHVQHRNRYVKPAITLGVLVGAMAISNLPYCTYLVVIAFCSSCKDPMMVRYWLFVCQFNALLDPLFYTLTQRKLKAYYRNQIRKICALYYH